MRTGLLFFGICLMLLGLVGCATPPKPRTIVSEFEYPESYDQVWSAVVATFAELNLPIDNMEKDSGLITTDWINFSGTSNEDYCDCGGTGIATEVSRSGKFNVFVRTIQDSAALKVNTQYTSRRRFGDSVGDVNCVSTGGLEARINELVQSHIE